ncbi:MAG: hypothetical protein ACI8UO_002680 [Verrucomicrobiales bacterium]|jgi:hypothetical protein
MKISVTLENQGCYSNLYSGVFRKMSVFKKLKMVIPTAALVLLMTGCGKDEISLTTLLSGD